MVDLDERQLAVSRMFDAAGKFNTLAGQMERLGFDRDGVVEAFPAMVEVLRRAEKSK